MEPKKLHWIILDPGEIPFNNFLMKEFLSNEKKNKKKNKKKKLD